jgi:dUTP pyrophosphatase
MYTLYLYTEDPDLVQRYSTASLIAGDAGIDLYVPDNLSALKDTVFLGHRISCRMTRRLDSGEEVDVSYYLYPRSSLSKTRLRLANSVGIIDAGYRGEIIAAFDVRPDTGESVVKYQRLVQICSPTLDPVRLVVVDRPHRETERGVGGFGSTGK